MKDLLETYTNTLDSIFEKFGLKNGYGEINICINYKWRNNYDSVLWMENECLYLNDICDRTEYNYENFVMFYVDNGCGDNYYQIFDNNLKDETLEDSC